MAPSTITESHTIRLLDLGTGHDQQPDGTPLGDRGISRDLTTRERLSRLVHQRFEVHRRRNGEVAASLDCARVEAEKRQRGTSRALERSNGDRKSTRLNSSHVEISSAVVCLI